MLTSLFNAEVGYGKRAALGFILGPTYGHLNPVGHRIVAGAIAARLGHRASRAETSAIPQ